MSNLLTVAISLGALLVIGLVLQNLIRNQFERARTTAAESDATLRQELG